MKKQIIAALSVVLLSVAVAFITGCGDDEDPLAPGTLKNKTLTLTQVENRTGAFATSASPLIARVIRMVVVSDNGNFASNEIGGGNASYAPNGDNASGVINSASKLPGSYNYNLSFRTKTAGTFIVNGPGGSTQGTFSTN